MHTYGKAFRDVVRALTGDFSPAPDAVAYPKNEQDIERILAWAAKKSPLFLLVVAPAWLAA